MAIDLRANMPPRSYRDFDVTKGVRAVAAGVDVERVAAGVTDDILTDVWPTVEDPAFLMRLAAVSTTICARPSTCFADASASPSFRRPLSSSPTRQPISPSRPPNSSAPTVSTLPRPGAAGIQSLGRRPATRRCSTS